MSKVYFQLFVNSDSSRFPSPKNYKEQGLVENKKIFFAKLVTFLRIFINTRPKIQEISHHSQSIQSQVLFCLKNNTDDEAFQQ